MKEYIEHARKKFANHVAVYRNLGSISILDWRKPGTINYSLRYVFDKEGHTMTITGDLGYAVVCPTCMVDLEHCADAFRNSIDYFVEKIQASSDLYVYDEDMAKKTLEEYLLSDDDLSGEERAERVVLIEDIMEDFNVSRPGVRVLEDDTSNELNRVDPDAWEWIGTIGRRYHLRVYLWMYGLQMAWDQIKAKQYEKEEYSLGYTIVKFKDTLEENPKMNYGLLSPNGDIICLCCGGTVEQGEYEILENLGSPGPLNDMMLEVGF